ncbi:hypothetical protein JZ751_004848 [Albula glossodonta]|uniref:Uncharacterized protein n=1 Tax=Albula glossodonta TaxID=121402 RepID=A0A8T2P7Q3_9TELE|nr:hypothetical protein JZ751_004848 [Albula glossodonta]
MPVPCSLLAMAPGRLSAAAGPTLTDSVRSSDPPFWRQRAKSRQPLRENMVGEQWGKMAGRERDLECGERRTGAAKAFSAQRRGE